MRLYLRGSRDALFFHPMTPQKGKPIHYLICVCDCISVVALKIAQTLINKQWIHCNGKIKGDLPWKGQKKEKKNSGKLQRWGPEWTTQKGHFSGSLPFSLILELSHEVLKARKEKCTWTCPLKCIFPWRDLPGNDQKSILALYCGFCDIRVVKVPIKDLLRHHFYSKITRLGLPWPWIWVAGSVLFFLLVASHFPVKMNWTILKVTERKLVLFSLTS